MAIKTRNKKITVAAMATLLATSLFATLLHKAPDVEPSFPVTSPSTRGFGAPGDSSDFTQARFFNLGLHTWNKGALLPLQAAVRAVERLNIWEPTVFSGSYNFRRISGSSAYSHHSWAVAVDFNAAQNGMGVPVSQTQIGNHPDFVYQFKRFGFYWGGNFSRPDAMHFEYDGPALVWRAPRFPGGPDINNVLARTLIAIGLPAVKDGRYDGAKEFTSVLAFQKKNGLLKIDAGGQVQAPTWTLLLLRKART